MFVPKPPGRFVNW